MVTVQDYRAFNGDSGVLTIEKNGNKLSLVMSEQKSVFEKTKRAISRVDMTEQAVYLLTKSLSTCVWKVTLPMDGMRLVFLIVLMGKHGYLSVCLLR